MNNPEKFVKKNCLILLSFLVFYFCQAQRSEVGVLMGTSFYLGDLNNIPFKDAQFAGGFIYRYNFSPRWALKANILFGKIAASDEKNHSLLKDEKGNYAWDYQERKLSFSSPITEIAAQIELNFFNIYNVTHKNQISPYLFGGAAFFSFNPQAVYKEITYDLQLIGTEGQGRSGMQKKYPLTGFAIPFGIGFKANIGRYVCVGAEWGLRFTFTDYLDDVGGLYYDFSSQEGKMSPESFEVITHFADPSTPTHAYNSQRYSTIKTDWYSFAGIILTVRIGNEDRFCGLKTNIKLKHRQGRKQ
jgi:hypothetical protein